MQSVKKISIAVTALLLVLCASNGFAQTNTSTAAAGATIVAPISLSKTGDMNFGNTSVAAGIGGAVILAPSGARTIAGAGVTLPAATGTVSAAGFTVSGAPGFTYTITLPSSVLINGPGAATMTVSSFTSIPSATGTLNMAGTQSLAVGATLTVAPGQQAGVYTNATALPVTVNYN